MRTTLFSLNRHINGSLILTLETFFNIHYMKQIFNLPMNRTKIKFLNFNEHRIVEIEIDRLF